MKSKRGSATPLLLLVILVSVLVNVYLFRMIGQARLEKERTPISVPSMNYVREIAQTMGMKPASGRTEADIAMDIKLSIRDAPEAPKDILSDDSIGKMLKLLKPEDRKILNDWQDFAKKAVGKQFLIITGE